MSGKRVQSGMKDAAPDLSPEPRRDTPKDLTDRSAMMKYTDPALPMADGPCVEMFPCEHFWVSRHQPDFPSPIYWVRVCGLCDEIDSADLARELARGEAS